MDVRLRAAELVPREVRLDGPQARRLGSLGQDGVERVEPLDEHPDLEARQSQMGETARVPTARVVVLVHHHPRAAGKGGELCQQPVVALGELVEVALEVRSGGGVVAGRRHGAQLHHHVPTNVVRAHAHEDRPNPGRPLGLRQLWWGRERTPEVLGTEGAGGAAQVVAHHPQGGRSCAMTRNVVLQHASD